MKVVITARDFDVPDGAASEALVRAGFEVSNYTASAFGAGTDGEILASLIGDAECVVVGSEEITSEIICRCPGLRLISRRGVGTDSIDLEAARSHGITVARTLHTVESAVAEHIMAYLLYFARRIDLQNRSIHAGEWNRMMMPGLKGRTLGLIGFGGIARETAKRAVPFGMRVLYYCRHPEQEEFPGARYASMDQLLRESDYVSVNVPLTPDTAGMFSREIILRMKPGSILINTARSPVVDQQALRKALDDGHLAGAAIDVFDEEPCRDNPFLEYENVVMTPHTAPFTVENFAGVNRMAAQNVIDFAGAGISRENIVV